MHSKGGPERPSDRDEFPAWVSASRVSTRIVEALRGVRAGRIHSAFQNAVNIEIADRFLVSILPGRIPPNPRSLHVPDGVWERVRKGFGAGGAAVEFANGPACLLSCSGVAVDLGRARPWDPAPWIFGIPADRELLNRNLGVLEDLLSRRGHGGTLPGSTSDPFDKAFRLSEKRLADAIYDRDRSGIGDAARGLIGLGTGLTPSGDDLLCGVMVSNVYCGLAFPEISHWAASINESIKKIGFSETNVFSRHMLQHAVSGEALLPSGDVMRGLLCGCDRRGLLRTGSELLTLGSDSGANMLRGLLLGTRLILRLD